MFPIIPLLALIGIASGVTALVWYSDLSRSEREKADRTALKWFGKRFRDLSEAQQDRIRARMEPPD